MRRDTEMGTIVTTQDIKKEGSCGDSGESGEGGFSAVQSGRVREHREHRKAVQEVCQALGTMCGGWGQGLMICQGCNKYLWNWRSKYKSYEALSGCNLGARDHLQVWCRVKTVRL